MFEKVGTLARKMWRYAWSGIVFVAGFPMMVVTWFLSEDALWADWSEEDIQAYLAECREDEE